MRRATDVLTMTDQQMVPAGNSLVFAKTAMLMNPKLLGAGESAHLPGAGHAQERGHDARRHLGPPRHPLLEVRSDERLHHQRQAPEAPRLGAEADQLVGRARRGHPGVDARVHDAHAEGGRLELHALGPLRRARRGTSSSPTSTASSCSSPAWTPKAIRPARPGRRAPNAFRSMVTYFRNNPSILIWEGGNQATKTSFAHIME